MFLNALSTKASGHGSLYFSNISFSNEPALTPILTEQSLFLAAVKTLYDLGFFLGRRNFLTLKSFFTSFFFFSLIILIFVSLVFLLISGLFYCKIIPFVVFFLSIFLKTDGFSFG